ncbi:hypothetical protein GCM10008955_29170 [Deinococcus malanensis]|uniref:Uncharacterized protein n=1 Tax=Deinococcus malanensis TaxID=1706855 RepID=A0ABQ2EZP3_9DEIO|nr:hypothetical protein [Deinococcus malanensis]GGK33310.1 hypothetical protein GCM10008955_29170 [Deinococcus malanensis]
MDLVAAKQTAQQLVDTLSVPAGTRLEVDVDINPDRLNIIATRNQRAGVVIVTKEALAEHGHQALGAAIERLRMAVIEGGLPLLTGAPVQLGMLDARGWTDGRPSPYTPRP